MPSMPSSDKYIIDGKTDAERYLTAIYDGKIVTSVHMRRLADIMLPRFHEPYKDFHFDVKKALRPVQFIENFTCFPEGEKQGQPFELDIWQRAALELGFGFVDDDGYRQFRQVLMMVGRKNGKALSLDTEIPTPDGWKLMRDIHPGDYVFGQDGKPSKVIVESEIFDKPMYLVTFEDGATIKASGDHIWTVQSKKSKKACAYTPRSRGRQTNYRDGGWYEATTDEIAERFVHVRKDGKGCEYLYRAPMNEPVEYGEKELPVDPYLLGAWLGDGTSQNTRITICDDDAPEMLLNLMRCGYAIKRLDYSNKAPFYYVDPHPRGWKAEEGSFRHGLKTLGVLGNKHIPDIYLQGSIEQRWELLRGLMDTDGYCGKNGECEFVQKSKLLAEQVVELCASLGIKTSIRSKNATCNGSPAGIVYRVNFFTDKQRSCFKLSRKHERLKDKLAPRMSCKSIVNVERISNEPSKCIAISNDSHLYLAGRHYTATHNSSLMAALALYFLTSDGEPGAEVLCIANSEQQARRVFGHADLMRRKSPALRDRIRRGMSQKRGTSGLNYDKNGSILVSIPANVATADGYSSSAYIYDELAACTDMGAMLAAIEESVASRRQASGWIISSENYVRHGIWDMRVDMAKDILAGKVVDDTLLPILYCLDTGDAYNDSSVFIKANPGLASGIKSMKYMEDRANAAANSPQIKSSFMTKDLCLRATSYTSFLTQEECHNPEMFEVNPKTDRYGCLGFDLSSVGDLTACCCMFMRPGDDRIYEITHAWIPEAQVEIVNGAKDLKERDGVPYHLWASGDHPWMTIVPGDKIDAHQAILGFVDHMTELGIYIRYAGYDQWHVDDYLLRELHMRIGSSNCFKVQQNAQTLSPLMKEHRIDLRAHRIINPSPVNEFGRASVMAREDAAGNFYPNKKELKPQNKIDPYMAELFAYKMLKDNMDVYKDLIGWYPPQAD